MRNLLLNLFNPLNWLIVALLLVITALLEDDMRPNRLQQIKAEQIAAAEKAGRPSPYAHLGQHAAAPAVATTGGSRSGDLLAQMQTAMTVDLQRIKAAGTLDERAQIKAQLLPNYLPFVDDYVTQGHDYPNDVAVWAMVWLFDTGQIEQALKLGFYLVDTGHQQLPARFDRSVETFIADAVYDWANEQLKAEHSASPYLDDLVLTLTANGWDLPPMVASKNLVMLAKHRFRERQYVECLALCDRAEAANPEGAGVKTLRKNAQRELGRANATA